MGCCGSSEAKEGNAYRAANSTPSQSNPGGSAADNRKSRASSINLKVLDNDPHSVLALYDYEPRVQDDLGFKKGEKLKVLDRTDPAWWRAQNGLGKIGYIPSNYVAQSASLKTEDWFHGTCKRTEAEKTLRSADCKSGSFLIRESESAPGSYALSCRFQDQIKHYRISRSPEGKFFITRRVSFESLHELVSHYSERRDGIVTRLDYPAKNPNVPQIIGLAYDQWEIDRNELELIKKLGHGQFGEVWQGTWRGITQVAIKTFKPGSMSQSEFIDEAQIMKKLHHPNLVQLMAVCSREQPVYIITELMENGDLLNYLRQDKVGQVDILIDMAVQVCTGMQYLETKNFIHRDLAARNVLVGKDSIVKVADFGMSKVVTNTEYKAQEGAKFPVKWAAPEVAQSSKFSTKSDVWSFGILLWEIMSKGCVPYPGMNNTEVLREVNHRGYRMQAPAGCSPSVHRVMLDCWEHSPDNRPHFVDVRAKLEAIYNSLFEGSSPYADPSQMR